MLKFTEILLLTLLVLNMLVEINTSIKKHLNFKKFHKVHLQDYCNNKMLPILIENKADAEYDTDT